MDFSNFNFWNARPVGRGYFIADGHLVKTCGGKVVVVSGKSFPV